MRRPAHRDGPGCSDRPVSTTAVALPCLSLHAATTGRIDNFVVTDELAVVPEPSVYMLLGVGLLFCGQRFVRRKSA